MKQQVIKKKLLTETGIIAAGLLVLCAIAYYFGTLADDYEKENSTLAGEVTGIGSEMSALREKYATSEKYASLYREAMEKSAHAGLTVNRQTIKESFDQFKNTCHLVSLKLTMAPLVTLSDAKYKRDSEVMESSDVVVTLEALSDEDIYALLHAMQIKLPGVIKVTQLTISRANLLTDAMIQAVSKEGPKSFVKGELHFTWFGMKPVINANSNTNAPAKTN